MCCLCLQWLWHGSPQRDHNFFLLSGFPSFLTLKSNSDYQARNFGLYRQIHSFCLPRTKYVIRYTQASCKGFSALMSLVCLMLPPVYYDHGHNLLFSLFCYYTNLMKLLPYWNIVFRMAYICVPGSQALQFGFRILKLTLSKSFTCCIISYGALNTEPQGQVTLMGEVTQIRARCWHWSFYW